MSYKWFRSVALIVVLFGMLWIITVSSVFAQDMLPQATPPNAVTGESFEEAQTVVPQPDWETYTSPVFGFSFDYPQGWAVDIPAFTPGPDQYGYVITVRPTSDTDLADSKIEIANTNIEFAEGRSFERWVAVHDQAEPVFRDPPTINILGNYKLATRGKPTQIVHVRTTWANFQAESVWINHGRLAYVFSTNSQTDASSDMLMKMVSSVRFAPNAPSSLNELYGTQRSWPSAEEMVLQIENSPKGAATSSECDIVCQDAKAGSHIQRLGARGWNAY